MHIALLHTAEVHVARFDTLLSDLGYEGDVTHRVAAPLLDRARVEGLEAVGPDLRDALRDLAFADAVLCTCSTLGPLADAVPGVLRIDRPAISAALDHGPRPLVAICLESTRAPTLSLLEDCARAQDLEVTPQVVMCDTAWPFFEAGAMAQFARQIAADITEACETEPKPTAVLLAQASMDVAAPLLADLPIPVLTTPGLAAQRLVQKARS